MSIKDKPHMAKTCFAIEAYEYKSWSKLTPICSPGRNIKTHSENNSSSFWRNWDHKTSYFLGVLSQALRILPRFMDHVPRIVFLVLGCVPNNKIATMAISILSSCLRPQVQKTGQHSWNLNTYFPSWWFCLGGCRPFNRWSLSRSFEGLLSYWDSILYMVSIL